MALTAMRHRGEQGGITCIEDLDFHLRMIGRLDLAIEANETAYNVEKQRLKDQYAKRKAELADERQPLLAAVETFMTAHRDELLGKKKAVRLDFGLIGWRKSKDDVPDFPKKGTEEMAALIKTLETWPKESSTRPVVAIQTEKYVLKSAIFKLADGILQVLGLTKKKGDDVFFVEPDREKLAEVADVS